MLSLLIHFQLYPPIVNIHTYRMKNALWIACVVALISSVFSQKKDICKRDNGFYPHEDYCDYYYECVDGTPFLQLCPNGLAFAGSQRRGLVKHCDYPHKVNCPDPENNRIMGQPPQGSGNCPYRFGIFPHEKSCTKYWLCWNGTSTVQKCPFSLLYNDVEHACDWPEKVVGCEQHPLCKGDPNGVKPMGNSCRHYWLCMGGYPRIQTCPAGLAFGHATGRCEWANNVPGCEPTPTPEEEDEKSLQKATGGNRYRGTSKEDDN